MIVDVGWMGVKCHAAGGPRHKWSGQTKHGATKGPPRPCTAANSWSPLATVGPPHRTWPFYPQYCYDSCTISIWLDIATTVFPELNGKTGTLSRDITAVISTIPAVSAVVSGHNIIR